MAGSPGEHGELLVISRAYDLARELTQRVRKFPRDVKFTLGDRILSTCYEVLDTLVEARYTRSRTGLLRRANVLLERLRFQIRLCADERVLSIGQYEYVARQVEEVGRLVGGWTKAASR